MTAMAVTVIYAAIKRDEKILLWGILSVLVIITGYVRNRNIHGDMKNVVQELINSENNNDSLMIKGTVDNITVKQNSVYYYLDNTYISREYLSEEHISGMQKEINIGKSILVCSKETDKVYSEQSKYALRDCVGQILCAEVKVYAFSSARNDGGFDEIKYYHSQKIWSRFKVSSEDKITLIKNHNITLKYKNWLYKVKKQMEVCIERICGNRYSGLYKGILLGNKEDIDSDEKELYRLSGISHILAISGLHISLIGYFVYRRMRKISGYIVSGITTIAIVMSYGMMIGCGASVQRAIIMFVIHIVGDIMGRSYDILSSMSMALLIMLIDNPMCINNSGVVLSFMAISGITVVYDNIKRIFEIKNKLIETLVVSECINIVTRPVIAMSYYEISLYSTAINIIVIPLMSVVVASGFIGMMLSSIHISLGKIFIYPGCMVLKLYGLICEHVTKLPYATKITGIPDNSRIIVYYSVIACSICVVRKILLYGKKSERRKKHYIIKTGCTGIIMAVLLMLIICNNNHALKIQMLDVGQGDCICINNGREVILTDGGSSSSKDIGSYTIIPFLKANGVEKVDYLMISHSDADHINGLMALMEYKYNGENYVKNVIMPKISDEATDKEYKNIVEKAEQEGIKVLYFKEGSGIDFYNMSIRCISPDRSISDNKNELSMVCYLKTKNITMIFTGDIGSESEKRLLENNLVHKVDILKVGHHGSDGSSTEDFLKELKPEVSIISCGINNSYGHPGRETLSRLHDVGSDVYITAESGQIDIVECKNGFKVETFLH